MFFPTPRRFTSFFPLLLILGLLTALSAKAAPVGRALYVSPSGNDDNEGSISSPWRSLGTAFGELQPGDTLYLRGGIYEEEVLPRRLEPGTPEQPILVRAFPGERPVLKGLLRLLRPTYWTFDGLNVTWNPRFGNRTEHMVKIGDGVGWTFRNAEVWNARSYAAILVYTTAGDEPRDWRITGCAVHDTRKVNQVNQDQLIYVNTGLESSGGRIDHNLLYNAKNGSAVKLGGPNAGDGGAAGVTVEYNTVYGTVQGVLVAWESWGNIIRRNLIGRQDSGYGAIRGYQVTGPYNLVTANGVFSTRRPIVNDRGYLGLYDGGGNRNVGDPQFNKKNPTGFRPRKASAAKYGRYASAP